MVLVLVAAALALAFALRPAPDEEFGPRIDPPPDAPFVAGHYGRDGALEALLVPLDADPAVAAFLEETWRSRLGPAAAEKHLRRLLLVNHGDRPLALPATDAFRLTRRGTARDLGRGIAEVAPELLRGPSALQALLRLDGAVGRREIEPAELLAVIVVLDLAPESNSGDGIGLPAFPTFEMRPARIDAKGLRRFREAPRGSLEALVVYDGSPQFQPSEVEHAERGRQEDR